MYICKDLNRCENHKVEIMALSFWGGTVKEDRWCPHSINHEEIKRPDGRSLCNGIGFNCKRKGFFTMACRRIK
jgi:hypothetical protein